MSPSSVLRAGGHACIFTFNGTRRRSDRIDGTSVPGYGGVLRVLPVEPDRPGTTTRSRGRRTTTTRNGRAHGFVLCPPTDGDGGNAKYVHDSRGTRSIPRTRRGGRCAETVAVRRRRSQCRVAGRDLLCRIKQIVAFLR